MTDKEINLPGAFEILIKELSEKELVSLLIQSGSVDDQETIIMIRKEIASRKPND